MKRRNGFVSNSSSCCFILDLSKEGAKEIVDKVVAREPCGLDRCTAKAIGKNAVSFAREWNIEMGDWGSHFSLGDWILEYAEKIGEDNIVFLRESDEGMGGYLFDNDRNQWDDYGQDDTKFKALYEQLEKLKETEMEYH